MTDLSELKGADFRARRRLSDADDTTLAEVGESCERVPVASLGPLLESGHIEPAPSIPLEDEAPS